MYLTEIGYGSFYDANSETVTIGENVKIFGDYAFYYVLFDTLYYNAKNANDLVEGNGVFSYAGTLNKKATLYIGENVERIPNYMFNSTSNRLNNTRISIIDFGNSKCSEIGNHAFAYTVFEEIKFNNNLYTIGNYAFYNSGDLTYSDNKPLVIPDCVTGVGDYAFASTTFTSFTIGWGVMHLGVRAFAYNSYVETLYYNAYEVYSYNISQDTGAFAGLGTETDTTVYIDSSVYAIPDYLMYYWDEENDESFDISVETLEFKTYEYNYSTLESIGSFAFAGLEMTYVNIPNSVTFIGEAAFGGCENLYKVYIGKSVEEIGMLAFGLCPNLAFVEYNATSAEVYSDYYTDASLIDGTGYFSVFYYSGVNYCENGDYNGMSVKIGRYVEKIPAFMFSYSAVAFADFSGSLCGLIENYAFSNLMCKLVMVL